VKTPFGVPVVGDDPKGHRMRKIVSYLLCSLDGVIEDPPRWVFDSFDGGLDARLLDLTQAQDTVLLGRRTYEEWAAYWPSSSHEPFASFINTTPKQVASTTLRRADWENTTVIDGDLADSVTRLRAGSGGDIGVHGSATLVRTLLQADLLDELVLAVFPVVGGQGRRLFEDLDRVQRLQLVSADQTATGVMLLTYRPNGADPSTGRRHLG
jgi:dihydrofolate reductase